MANMQLHTTTRGTRQDKFVRNSATALCAAPRQVNKVVKLIGRSRVHLTRTQRLLLSAAETNIGAALDNRCRLCGLSLQKLLL